MAIGSTAGFARIVTRATVEPLCWDFKNLLQLMYLRYLLSSFQEESSHCCSILHTEWSRNKLTQIYFGFHEI